MIRINRAHFNPQAVPLIPENEMYRFTALEVSPDVHASQGVAKGKYFFYTSNNPKLYRWDMNWNLLQERQALEDGPPGVTMGQVNGIYYDQDEDRLYVSSGNHDVTPHQGWIIEYDPNTLEPITYHDAGQQRSEALCKWDGSWWVVGGTFHAILQYDLEWNFVAQHDLPDPSPEFRFWQAIFVVDDVFYLNAHSGQTGPPLRAYTWNGSGFDLLTTNLRRPSYACTQGAYFDGKYVWWAGRSSGVNQDRHVVIKSNARGHLFE